MLNKTRFIEDPGRCFAGRPPNQLTSVTLRRAGWSGQESALVIESSQYFLNELLRICSVDVAGEPALFLAPTRDRQRTGIVPRPGEDVLFGRRGRQSISLPPAALVDQAALAARAGFSMP
ncbi:hypothetical protein [Kaistia sp. MMO-174]|uniref:hypothetical protein n=1 Tax=Kaistia sp. MMO-174 TaxID=3081256 RepID=UPI00301A8FD8